MNYNCPMGTAIDTHVNTDSLEYPASRKELTGYLL